MRLKQSWLNWRKLIVDDRELSFGAKSIALYLNTYMNDSHDMAFPSLERIRGELNIGSFTTLIKYLDELEKTGYLKREKRFGNSTIYHAVLPRNITSITESVVLQNMEHSITESGSTVLQNLEPNKQENKQSNKQDTARVKTSPKSTPCPYRQIVDIYHDKLPMCPKVIKLTENRKRAIRARWNGDADNMKFWEDYFGHVAKSRFLTGKVDPPPGRKQFIADIDFLIKESTMVKTQEGKYHG